MFISHKRQNLPAKMLEGKRKISAAREKTRPSENVKFF